MNTIFHNLERFAEIRTPPSGRNKINNKLIGCRLDCGKIPFGLLRLNRYRRFISHSWRHDGDDRRMS